MPRSASARRYAQAVFQIAAEQGELEKWLTDLATLVDAVREQGYAGVLDAPQIPLEEKMRRIREAFGDSVSPLALNLMSLLASRNGVNLLTDITEVYQQMLDEHQGIERAEVISAVTLSDEQQQQVATVLHNMVGKEIQLTTRVEPSILGGLVARVGDRVLDGSTKTKLDALRRELVHA